MSDERTIDDSMAAIERLIDDLDEIPRAAFALYRGYAAAVLLEHDLRAAAACVYSHMVAEAERRFSNRRGIIPKDVRGLKVWLVDDKAVIRWKKMDEDGRSRNYPTKQAQDYDRGLQLPGLPPPAVRLSVGYWLDPTQTEFVRTQVACPKGRAVLWCAAIVPADAANGGKRWVDVTRQKGFGT